MTALQRYARGKRADLAVAQWLRQRNVPRRLVAEFWQPLVWGALNTPLEHASLRVLCNVLSDGVWADKSGSDYLLPKRDLGAIIAEPALAKLKQYGADIRLETRVGRLKNLPDGRVVVNDEAFDAVIIATAPYHAVHLFLKILRTIFRRSIKISNTTRLLPSICAMLFQSICLRR